MSKAGSFLKKMKGGKSFPKQASPAASGNKAVGGAKQSTKMVKAAGKMGRKSA